MWIIHLSLQFQFTRVVFLHSTEYIHINTLSSPCLLIRLKMFFYTSFFPGKILIQILSMVRQHVRKTWDSIQQMCFCDTLCFPTSCPHISSFVSSAFWGLQLIISSTKINQVSKDKEVASVWKSEFQKQSRKQSSHLNLRNKTNIK